MTDMAYTRRSNKTLADTVEVCNSKFASAMVEANPLLALHLPCPVVVREDDHGVEVSVLRPSYVSSLFPTTFFGEGPAESEADLTGIVDDSVS